MLPDCRSRQTAKVIILKEARSVNPFLKFLFFFLYVIQKPLQLFIREMLMQSDTATDIADAELASQYMQMVQVIKYAVIVIATVPIMCVYPFLQKYFVQGVASTGIKG